MRQPEAWLSTPCGIASKVKREQMVGMIVAGKGDVPGKRKTDPRQESERSEIGGIDDRDDPAGQRRKRDRDGLSRQTGAPKGTGKANAKLHVARP